MRRFIDVIFVHPKKRQYVVLHQGRFWQLPRLNLSANAWLLKLLYTGGLGEIFVAKDQHINDPKLQQVLSTHALPDELHGISAQKFLGWWQVNDYKWQTPTVPQPTPSTKTVITANADYVLERMRHEKAHGLPALAMNRTPTKTQNTSDGVSSVNSLNATPAQASNAPRDNASKDNASSDNISSNNASDDFAIFDRLLQELHDEVIKL